MPTAQHRSQRRLFLRLQGFSWTVFGLALIIHGHTYPTIPRWLPDVLENVDLFGIGFTVLGLGVLGVSTLTERRRAAETLAFVMLFVPPGIVGVTLIFSGIFGAAEGGVIFGILMLMLAAVAYLMAGLRPVVVHTEAVNGGGDNS